MAVLRHDFTGVDGTESAAQLLPGSEDRVMEILQTWLDHTAGDGTRWRVRYYRGTTAAPTDEYAGGADMPAVAATWYSTSPAEQDVAQQLPALHISTRLADYPGGWSGGEPAAGLGVYVTAEQLSNAGAGTDTLEIATTLRRGA